MNIDSDQLLPAWTKPGQWSLGRDPLGIQATSVRMYRTLVPGLTNVTNRLRYYSYYCWVVALWEKIRHADDEHAWQIFIRRAEALYALACYSIDADTTGLAGSDWARNHWAQHVGTQIDLVPHTDQPGQNGQYLKAKRGNFGQFYVASMIEVNLLADSVRIPIVAKDGRELANAFALAVGDDVVRQLTRAIDRGSLSRAALQGIGAAVHPSLINGNSREMRLLREFLWPSNSDVSGFNARRTTAWLLLDLARKSIQIFDGLTLRRAFYQRTLPNGNPYLPGGKVIDRWRAFHANELCHIALEALLNGMASKLLRHTAGVDPNKLVNELIDTVLPTSDQDLPWSVWAVQANGSAPDAEESLSAEVLDGLRRFKERAEDKKVLLAAARILGILFERWGTGKMKVRGEVAQFTVRHGASLEGVLAVFEEACDQTVAQALATVVRRYVIAEHLAIAGRKLALSGKYTYRFVLEDGALSNGWPTEYGYTNPRLGNLATFLVDAKLVAENGRVTATGLSLLDAYQPS